MPISATSFPSTISHFTSTPKQPASHSLPTSTTSTSQTSNNPTTTPSPSTSNSTLNPPTHEQRTKSSAAPPVDPTSGQPIDFENYFSEEEKEKLRAKGVNPTLKAEMEWRKANSPAKGFWGKVGQLSWGGGVR